MTGFRESTAKLGMKTRDTIADLPFPASILRYQVPAMPWSGGKVLGEGSYGNVTLEKDPKNRERQIAVKWSVSPRE
jgi:hypothetical protein